MQKSNLSGRKGAMPLIIAYSAIYLAENPSISMLLAVPGVEVTTTFHMMHIKVIHTRSQR